MLAASVAGVISSCATGRMIVMKGEPGSLRFLAGEWDVVDAAPARNLKEASGLVAADLAWHLERGLKSLVYVER